MNLAQWLLGMWVEETEPGAPVERRVICEQTGRGIIGAAVYILWPGADVGEWCALWERNPLADEDVEEINYWLFADCTSGIDGRFSLDHLLPCGYEYSIVVAASYHEPMIVQDWLDIDNSRDRDITLELARY